MLKIVDPPIPQPCPFVSHSASSPNFCLTFLLRSTQYPPQTGHLIFFLKSLTLCLERDNQVSWKEIRCWDLVQEAHWGALRKPQEGERATGLGKERSLTTMHPKLRSQAISCESLELRWSFRDVINCVYGLCAIPHIDQSLEVGFPFGKRKFLERDSAEIHQQPSIPAVGNLYLPPKGICIVPHHIQGSNFQTTAQALKAHI